MKKTQVINLDPIDRKKKLGLFSKLIRTRYHGGKVIKKTDKFGHYLFCGKQRSGKSVSVLWYAEKLAKRYKRKGFEVDFYSNVNIGKPVDKFTLYDVIKSFDPYAKVVRIVIIDEIHAYFPKESRDKKTIEINEKLISLFSQLGKRNTYILSTAQIYGRLDKSLREQCLYMVNCTNTLAGRIKNEFIDGDDIMVDELGRWAGNPTVIHIHGLPKTKYDTKLIIE